jgi:uncharacterized protein (DUF2062 family)
MAEPRWLNPDDTLKRWLKRIMPDPRELLKNRQLSVFGRRLQDPNLWHLNRRSASGAFALGLFMMYVPLPGQMFWAGWMAILLRLNLSISVLLCLITNPLTIPPIYYFSYLLGSWLLGQSPRGFDLDFWLDLNNWLVVLAPLAMGLLICALASSALGYFGIQFLWRWHLMRQIKQRRARYRELRVMPVTLGISAPSAPAGWDTGGQDAGSS